MITVNTSNNLNNVIYSGNTGQILIHNGSSDSISIDKNDKNLIEYIDLLYQIMGIDITYEKWKNMSSGEKLQLIRDIKLKKIIEE
jgi:hypothetical protein